MFPRDTEDMTKQTFTLRTPDGVEHKRTSVNHQYLCASVGQIPATHPYDGSACERAGEWVVITWHRSPQAAPKNQYGFYVNLKLVEVTPR